MKRAGFEADRFAILLKDLVSGETHEVAPDWDRSALSLRWSADGRVLYTMADDVGQRRLFAVEVGTGRVLPLTNLGTVRGFDAGRNGLVYALDNLGMPRTCSGSIFIRVR